MTQQAMNDVVLGLTEKAELMLKQTQSPQELIGKVIQQGTKAVMTKNLTMDQAENMTAMLIAALTLAKK